MKRHLSVLLKHAEIDYQYCIDIGQNPLKLKFFKYLTGSHRKTIVRTQRNTYLFLKMVSNIEQQIMYVFFVQGTARLRQINPKQVREKIFVSDTSCLASSSKSAFKRLSYYFTGSCYVRKVGHCHICENFRDVCGIESETLCIIKYLYKEYLKRCFLYKFFSISSNVYRLLYFYTF